MVSGKGYSVTVPGSAVPTFGFRLGSLKELYFLVVEYSRIAVPWSVVQVVVFVVVVVWAEAMPMPARSTAAVTAEISDLLIGVSLCWMLIFGLPKRWDRNAFQVDGCRMPGWRNWLQFCLKSLKASGLR